MKTLFLVETDHYMEVCLGRVRPLRVYILLFATRRVFPFARFLLAIRIKSRSFVAQSNAKSEYGQQTNDWMTHSGGKFTCFTWNKDEQGIALQLESRKNTVFRLLKLKNCPKCAKTPHKSRVSVLGALDGGVNRQKPTQSALFAYYRKQSARSKKERPRVLRRDGGGARRAAVLFLLFFVPKCGKLVIFTLLGLFCAVFF